MQLEGCEVIKSPSVEGAVRLVGEVTYDRRFARSERIWFEVSERHAEFLTDSGNPWLACLLPLAVTLGEPLRICRPVDRELYNNVQELMRIWVGWYPHFQIVSVEADLSDPDPRFVHERTGCLFSAGLDSFHTILNYDAAAEAGSHAPIDELIVVWGFDVPIGDHKAIQQVGDRVRRAAGDLGKELVAVGTNLRETRFHQADLSKMSHASMLIGCVLALETMFSKVLISSSYAHSQLQPWGSHPHTDPLHATAQTKVLHYGAEFSRTEKTAYIARSEVALRSLRVCGQTKSGENCGICNKCYRTMITLELFDALERCAAFKGKKIDPDHMAKIYADREYKVIQLRDIQTTARKMGRTDIADALECSFQHTDRLNQSLLFSAFWMLWQRLRTHQTFWKLISPVRSIIKPVTRKVVGIL
jgi:hypothetical protein